jgi:hypothetical protein
VLSGNVADDLCARDRDVFFALVDCMCGTAAQTGAFDGPCATQCHCAAPDAMGLAGEIELTTECLSCSNAACAAEFNACAS